MGRKVMKVRNWYLALSSNGFNPNTTEDLSCRGADDIKSAVDQIPLVEMVWKFGQTVEFGSGHSTVRAERKSVGEAPSAHAHIPLRTHLLFAPLTLAQEHVWAGVEAKDSVLYGIVVSDADYCAVSLGSNPREGMNVCKRILPSQHGGTLNSRRAASLLVRLCGTIEVEYQSQQCNFDAQFPPQGEALELSEDAKWNKDARISLVKIHFNPLQYAPQGCGSTVAKVSDHGVAAVAEWYRYRIVACLDTSSSPVPLKTHSVGQRCTLNLSRAETSSRWWGVVVRRGDASSGVVHVT
ncbi:uncharacterized protein TNCV_52811 [Trichonephila clavipes]|nr:uncharacterized protein TNCV_52811 [Trichonephila clavipes]